MLLLSNNIYFFISWLLIHYKQNIVFIIDGFIVK